MELIGHQPNRVHGTAHFGNQPPSTQRTGSYGLSSGNFSDAYHVFTMKWENNLVEWYVDDVKFHTLTRCVNCFPSADGSGLREGVSEELMIL